MIGVFSARLLTGDFLDPLIVIIRNAGGFVSVSDILSTRQGSNYSEEDVRRVVSNCSKSRFALQEDPQTGILQIRANQGHTMQVHTLTTCWPMYMTLYA